MHEIKLFLRHLYEKGFAEATIDSYRCLLRSLQRFAETNGIANILQTTEHDLVTYIESRKPKVSGAVLFNTVCKLRQFYRYLVDQDLVFYSPAEALSVPKLRSISQKIIPASGMQQLLDSVRTDTPTHIRTKVILELAFSSALRSCEIRKLRIDQIDMADGTLFVDRTKTRRDRKVPVGAVALEWVSRYLIEIRPRFLGNNHHPVVFISHRGGNPLSASGYWRGIATTLRASRIAAISPHVIRASSATALLDAGMHVGFIAELLGHSELSTTQIYLRMSERTLTREIEAHHPRAHLNLTQGVHNQ